MLINMCDKNNFEGSYSGERTKIHFNCELEQVETFITAMKLFVERVSPDMYVAKQTNLSNGHVLCILFSATKGGKTLTSTTAGGEDLLFWDRCCDELNHIWSIPSCDGVLVSARTKFFRDNY